MNEYEKERKRQREKQRYHDRKDAGICVLCGINKAEEGKTRCSECLQKEKDKYNRRKELGICTKCGKETALIKSTLCYRCDELRAVREERRVQCRTDEQKAERSKQSIAYKKARENKRTSEGKCTECGKKLKDKRFKTCLECRLRARRYNNQKYNAHHYAEIGLCMWCGKQPLEGRKMCADCLKKMQDNAERHFRPNGVNIADSSYFRGLNHAFWEGKRRKANQVEGESTETC